MSTIEPYQFSERGHVNSDPNFPEVFLLVKRLIIDHIPQAQDIEHIGSTALPDIVTKKVIDTLIPTEHEQFDSILARLESMGFTIFPFEDIPADRPLRVGGITYKNKFYNLHVHLAIAGSDTHLDALYFRDKLLDSQELRSEYQRYKEEALKADELDPQSYNSFKQPFIKKVLNERKKPTDL